MYHTIILPNISSVFNRTNVCFSYNKIIAEKISLAAIFATKTDKLIKIDKNCGLVKLFWKGKLILIKTTRKRQRLTQKELAKRCNLSQSFLSELENKNNKKNVTIKQIIKIADGLNLNPRDLASWFIDKELNCIRGDAHEQL